jgi:rare lipoprotein A
MKTLAAALACALGAACAPPQTLEPQQQTAAPMSSETAGTTGQLEPSPPRPTAPILETAQGLASYYARNLHGRRTASGEILDLTEMVAAHPTYPFGTRVKVTNVRNLESVEVDIVDRGPGTGPRKDGVIIDLSRAAARKLQLFEDGRVAVLVEVLKWGEEAESVTD